MTSRTIQLAALLGVALIALPTFNCGKSPSQAAQPASPTQPGAAASFTYSEVAVGLSSPKGITLGGANTLIVSQQPAAPQDASIARINLGTGGLTLQGAGPAVHSGFAANHAGRLYWVDASSGALMTQASSEHSPAVLHAGGMLPATTLAVDAADKVYIAGSAPSPAGVAAVLVLGGGLASMPDPGGPEKTALAAGVAGDLYWTSSRDGLIYHRTPGGQGSVVLSGLNAPQGLSLDGAENILYFTEVPTPGISGAAGGRNTVNALDLATGARTVIHRGDPQPTGVVVAPNGKVTCTSTRRGSARRARPSRSSRASWRTATCSITRSSRCCPGAAKRLADAAGG